MRLSMMPLAPLLVVVVKIEAVWATGLLWEYAIVGRMMVAVCLYLKFYKAMYVLMIVFIV